MEARNSLTPTQHFFAINFDGKGSFNNRPRGLLFISPLMDTEAAIVRVQLVCCCQHPVVCGNDFTSVMVLILFYRTCNTLGQRGTMLHGDIVPWPKKQSCIVWTDRKCDCEDAQVNGNTFSSANSSPLRDCNQTKGKKFHPPPNFGGFSQIRRHSERCPGKVLTQGKVFWGAEWS